jgi:hypothetical protein
MNHEEILPCWIKESLKCYKPNGISIRALEALFDFMTEECKMNFLDVKKSLDILKILSESFTLFGDEQPTPAPTSTLASPPAFPNVEYNVL